MRHSTLIRHLGITVLAAVLLLALTYALDPFRDYQLATAAAYLCAVAGLTVLTGLNGQLSLGHGALMAIGGYTGALVENQFGAHNVRTLWIFPLSLVAGGGAAAAGGAVGGGAGGPVCGPHLARPA